MLDNILSNFTSIKKGYNNYKECFEQPISFQFDYDYILSSLNIFESALLVAVDNNTIDCIANDLNTFFNC